METQPLAALTLRHIPSLKYLSAVAAKSSLSYENGYNLGEKTETITSNRLRFQSNILDWLDSVYSAIEVGVVDSVDLLWHWIGNRDGRFGSHSLLFQSDLIYSILTHLRQPSNAEQFGQIKYFLTRYAVTTPIDLYDRTYSRQRTLLDSVRRVVPDRTLCQELFSKTLLFFPEKDLFNCLLDAGVTSESMFSAVSIDDSGEFLRSKIEDGKIMRTRQLEEDVESLYLWAIFRDQTARDKLDPVDRRALALLSMSQTGFVENDLDLEGLSNDDLLVTLALALAKENLLFVNAVYPSASFEDDHLSLWIYARSSDTFELLLSFGYRFDPKMLSWLDEAKYRILMAYDVETVLIDVDLLRECNPHSLKILIDLGLSPAWATALLYYAVQSGDYIKMMILLAAGADPNGLVVEPDPHSGNLSISGSVKDILGRLPLIFATIHRKWRAIEILAAAGVDLDRKERKIRIYEEQVSEEVQFYPEANLYIKLIFEQVNAIINTSIDNRFMEQLPATTDSVMAVNYSYRPDSRYTSPIPASPILPSPRYRDRPVNESSREPTTPVSEPTSRCSSRPLSSRGRSSRGMISRALSSNAFEPIELGFEDNHSAVHIAIINGDCNSVRILCSSGVLFNQNVCGKTFDLFQLSIIYEKLDILIYLLTISPYIFLAETVENRQNLLQFAERSGCLNRQIIEYLRERI